MKAEIKKANRPKYFIANSVCVRIDNIVFVQKSNMGQYIDNKEYGCSVLIGIGGNQPPVPIFCKDEIEQTAIFTQLSTILSLV